MKKPFFFIIAFILAFSVNSFSQIEITSNKVVYKRTLEDLPDYKKTFEINYPKISGIKDPAIKQNLENTLSYWKNFELNLEEELGDSYGLDGAGFDVIYNKNSILAIWLYVEVSGAYPSTLNKALVIDTRNGNRIFIRDLFKDIGPLLLKIDKVKTANEKEAVAETKKFNRDDGIYLAERLRTSDYSINTLEEFFISDKGVTFTYDYEFPHIAQALAPDSWYFFSWAELKPFIKPEGLLGQFVR